MDKSLKESLWKQFGASIEMIENALLECPYELWDGSSKFWYNAYHCIFYLDYYLTLDVTNFSPPTPFSLSELNPSGVLPDRVYTKEELLDYLAFSKSKCHNLIAGLTNETAQNTWSNDYRSYTVFEILLYNMRHVQHHAAQLNLFLRQGIDKTPGWISQTKIDLQQKNPFR